MGIIARQSVQEYNIGMTKRKKVYLPKWQRWFMLPLFPAIWAFITFEEFFGPSRGEMGMIGYVFMTALMWGLLIMMYLMTSGKLPAYIIEEDHGKKK